MIDCMQCGFENPDRNKFCQNCGSNLASVVTRHENNPGVGTTWQVNPLAPEQSETTNWQDPTDQINHNDAIASISEDALDEDEIAVSIEPDIEPDFDNTANQDASIDLDPELEYKELDANAITADVVDASDLASKINDIHAELNLDNPNTSDLDAQTINVPQLPVMATVATRKAVDAKPRLISMRHAGLTDVGKQRNHNEDNFAINSQITTHETPDLGVLITSRGLFVLCDGMGGHAGGEVASSMAIERIVEKFTPFWENRLPGTQKLREIIQAANQSIFELNESELRRDVGRMGTTLVLLSICNSEAAIAHVGDSRIYQITASGLKQITRDHEVANRLIDQGVESTVALSRYDAHQLTQALGPYANHQIEPAIAFLQILEPTLFLLCSDGLCDNDLVEQNWETYLLPLLAADADLRSGVKQLIDLANTINGHDNITAILVNCQVEPVNELD